VLSLKWYFAILNSIKIYQVTKKIKSQKTRQHIHVYRGEQKTKKLIKPRKPEKKKSKKPNCEKNELKFWKNWPVRFYKPETKKIKPNPDRKKPSQTGKNRDKPNQTGLNRFVLKNQTEPKPVSVFFKKI
jgi:hypothetical protein